MRKILLVEDNEDNRDMLTRRLTRQGFEVCSAVDGPAGVAMASKESPDLILMDVALGEMDGWEATQLIKAAPETAAIPIIALTHHRVKSVEVGCADFDTKPVDMPRLLELWHQGRLKLDTLISGKIKLDQINEGFDMLKSGAPVRNLIDFGVV